MKLNDKELSTPCVMTILNITPDSFYADSRSFEREQIEQRVADALSEGCNIVDIGGYSSRPMAEHIPVEEEWRRVELGIEAVSRVTENISISVDTFRSEVARRVLERRPDAIINDISAGELDDKMLEVVAAHNAPYVAMHMRGNPQSMSGLCDYGGDVVGELMRYFERRIVELESRGVRQIILDVGFGFAKSIEQNYELLAALPRFKSFGYPLLVGLSRKSMIYKPLGISPEESLLGTAALHWQALMGGADILRVHDTLAARQVITLYQQYKGRSI